MKRYKSGTHAIVSSPTPARWNRQNELRQGKRRRRQAEENLKIK